MEVSSALRIIESAMNERKALARVAEVLEVVADAERRTAELAARVEVKNIEIEGLDKVMAGLATDIEAARVRAVIDADTAREAFDAEALVWAGKIAEIEAYAKQVSEEIASVEDFHAKRVVEMHSIIYDLRAEADAEEARLDAARTALVEIKDRL